MTSAHCIVCERKTRWASALRCPLQQRGVRVYETRSLEDCWREVAEHSASVVGVEVTRANLASVVRWLVQVGQAFPQARLIACADRGLEPAQWLLREAGAAHVVFSPRNVLPLIRLIRRHLAAVPAEQDPVRQRIWRRLPWSDEDMSDHIVQSRGRTDRLRNTIPQERE